MDKWFLGKKHLSTNKYRTFIEAMKAGKTVEEISKMLLLDFEYTKEQYSKAMPRVKLEINIDMREKSKRICFGSKREPYYDDSFEEMEAWSIPKYEYEELGYSEKMFYEKNQDA